MTETYKMPKPRLLITEAPRCPVAEPPPRKTLADTTWEQRQGYRDRTGALICEHVGPGSRERSALRGMSVAELIELMGPLHTNHPKYEPRPRSLLPMPNLADVQPVISHCDARIRGQFKALWRLLAG